jgi:hypothetical protein
VPKGVQLSAGKPCRGALAPGSPRACIPHVLLLSQAAVRYADRPASRSASPLRQRQWGHGRGGICRRGARAALARVHAHPNSSTRHPCGDDAGSDSGRGRPDDRLERARYQAHLCRSAMAWPSGSVYPQGRRVRLHHRPAPRRVRCTRPVGRPSRRCAEAARAVQLARRARRPPRLSHIVLWRPACSVLARPLRCTKVREASSSPACSQPTSTERSYTRSCRPFTSAA